MTRPVEPHDLELYAINTGEFYQRHLTLARQCRNLALAEKYATTIWYDHVKHRVVPRYCREIEPVTASYSTCETVAKALAAYYATHLAEWKRMQEEES